MKHIVFSSLMIMLILTISGCGAQAVPTVNAVDVQHTAEAAAFTMVAQTQAAIPTATPLPPTETPTSTPAVTDTPFALPTQGSPVATISGNTANGAATFDPCSNRVLSAPEGKATVIRIVNTTNVPITVSMYLNETVSRGACGWRSFNLSKRNDIVFTDLVQGCYNLYAWSDAPKGKFNSRGGGCINNDDKWTFEVSSGTIKFVGP